MPEPTLLTASLDSAPRMGPPPRMGVARWYLFMVYPRCPHPSVAQLGAAAPPPASYRTGPGAIQSDGRWRGLVSQALILHPRPISPIEPIFDFTDFLFIGAIAILRIANDLSHIARHESAER